MVWTALLFFDIRAHLHLFNKFQSPYMPLSGSKANLDFEQPSDYDPSHCSESSLKHHQLHLLSFISSRLLLSAYCGFIIRP